MNRLLLILPLAGVAAGCAMTRVHYVDEAELVSRVNMSESIASAEFEMKTGERFKARRIVAEYDSLSFIVRLTSRPDGPIGFQRVASSSIRSMTITNHGEGAVEGLKAGAIAGTAVALAAALAELEEDEYDSNRVLISAAIILPLATVGGLLNGAALGMKHRYVIEPEGFEFLEKQKAPKKSFLGKVVSAVLGG